MARAKQAADFFTRINTEELQERLDGLCDIFPGVRAPRPRSPMARLSKLSFLEEISDEQLKSYTPGQLRVILTQRSNVCKFYTYLISLSSGLDGSFLKRH